MNLHQQTKPMILTKSDLLNHHPCKDGLEFAAACKFDFVKIWNTCERGDWLIWLLRKTNNITKPQAVQIAIECALHVIEKFEEKHPGDKRPRKAIESAQAWLENPSDENKRAAYANAYAADATDAAAYAYAAAYAAAQLSERKWQADKIRELIKCPFTMYREPNSPKDWATKRIRP